LQIQENPNPRGENDLAALEKRLNEYWDENLYARQYLDLSANNTLRYPNEEERRAILASMHKYTEKDQFNCCSCGYGTCLDMTVAIFNKLNRPENCHYYLATEREQSQQKLKDYQEHLEQLVENRTMELLATNEQLQAEIDERERIDEALKDSEQKLKEVLRGTPIPQFVIDRNHKILYWNKSLEQMTGVSAEKVINTTMHWKAFYEEAQPCLCDLLVEGSYEVIARRYGGECRKSQLIDGVYEGVHFFPKYCGNGEKWMYFTSTVIRDAKGAIVGAIETVEDITERRNTEIALEASQQASEAANRAKSEFLANMSHEIRTPMTAILGYLDLLSEQCNQNCPLAQSKDNNPIEVVTRNAKHLLQIIDAVLDLSKIEVGKLAVEHIVCSPCRILADVASLMRIRARTKGLALNVEFVGPMPETIRSDPTRLRQILLNVVGNAIKFTEAGGIRLVASIEQGEHESFLQIQVIDTGIGMSDQTLHGLFQPFSQADASTSRKFGGTGLGLAISQRLAQLLGGNITANSKLGVGSTFTVSVPVGSLQGVSMHADPAEVFAHGAESRKPMPGEPIRLPPCRILLAEDGVDNQRLLSLLLRKAGGDVVIAQNGQEAIELVRSSQSEGKPFDILLMDMQMPVLDGYDAVKQLRAEQWSRPIIAITAHAMADDRKKCEAAGCDGYITKPINRNHLLETVLKYLGPNGGE
jgi:signal transduction histidine kinase/ActR/RegA family two-component response regulator